MFKKRLRTIPHWSKHEPRYWRQRLYQNVFTYKGHRVKVRAWSVKIQLFGKRKAFTLSSPNRAQAAGEACHIYQTILEQGWEAVNKSRHKAAWARSVASPGSPISPASITYDRKYWKHRLIQRKYPEPPGPFSGNLFSVRIEYAHTSCYFPLSTSDENQAADRAMQIYRTVVNKGWEAARASFPRELSLALRWQDNPLAWTYTTFHTRQSPGPAKPQKHSGEPTDERQVALIEPDAGIRFALADCINQQDGFRCDAMFAGAPEALEEILRGQVDLALTNHDLSDPVSRACFEELHRRRPGLLVLPYSIYVDADELFKSTPGGSVVYMLKRTSPYRLFEPIAGMVGSQERIASQVRNYFQQLSGLLPSSVPFWKLAKLTPREQEILGLLAKGGVIKEIAASLAISNWTVQGHVKSIFEKLNVHSRTEAVVKYLQR